MFVMRFLGFLIALFIYGCAPPAPFKRLANAEEKAFQESAYDMPWWEGLKDPAINQLVESALADNPTLEQALAQIDVAKAYVGIATSAIYPTVAVTANVSKNYDGSAETGRSSLSAEVGPNLSWEVDLFGRIRHSRSAAISRLHARSSDASRTRIILASDVATTVLFYRACRFSRQALERDVASRTETLKLIRKRVQAGFSAQMDVDSAIRDLAIGAVNLAAVNESCEKLVHALVALCGMEKQAVQTLIDGTVSEAFAIDPPQSRTIPVNIEATALLSHPSVRAAEFEAEAAWAEIEVAKAERLPKLDLLGLLTGHWIRAAGTTLDFAKWALGAGASGVLFDGGKGAAEVDASEARYREALAVLQGTLRTAVREAQDALTVQHSANQRFLEATIALEAGQSSFVASEAMWKNGSISLLELEDSRRRLVTTQLDRITAKRDRAIAWVTLHGALGVPISSEGKDDEKS